MTTRTTVATSNGEPRWPKRPVPLSDRQRELQTRFLRLWHEHLPQRHRRVERFNHASAVLHDSWFEGCRTLEVGAGLGEHLCFEDLDSQAYTALEIRKDFVDAIRARFPHARVLEGDIERGVALPDASFDRILAVHVLEHLRNLPAALDEIRRLLASSGTFVAVLPCEGGTAYSLARRVSAQRLFERTFREPYGPIIANEHVSTAREILDELATRFDIVARTFWPARIPSIAANLVIAVRCVPKPVA